VVTITGQLTNFVQGATQASFGAGISVGGAAAGGPGFVAVMNSTTAMATLNIAADAPLGGRTVTVQTGTQQVSLNSGFTVLIGLPVITSVTPNSGQQGQALPSVAVVGQFTNFVNGTTVANFGSGITVNSTTVTDATHATVSITILGTATLGGRTVTMTTGTEVASLNSGFTVGGVPVITSVTPNTGQQGQTLPSVAVVGQFTNFVNGTTVANFGAGITVNSTTVTDATHATVSITVLGSATLGGRTVTMTTGSEVASLNNGFTVGSLPVITSVTPSTGQQGQTLPTIAVVGQFTNFVNGTTVASFGGGITVNSTFVTDATHATVSIAILGTATLGGRTVTMTTGTEVAALNNGFTVGGIPVITSVTPNTGQQGQTLPTGAVVGQFTNFVNGTTVANFGAGITVNSTAVTDATHATVSITILGTAALGGRTVTMTTGTEVASLNNGFTVSTVAQPGITDFNPKSGPVGTLVTVSGTNLAPAQGTAAQVSMSGQGAGTIAAPVDSATPTSLAFTVPPGAATGLVSITVNSGTATTSVPFTVTPSSNFTLTVGPSPANLIQGQSVSVAAALASQSQFNQLAALGVTGLPSGVTAAFKPPNITAGQTAVLTLTASANQPIATSNLSVSAAATVDGLPVTQSAPVSLSVVARTTTLLGRTVVSDAAETPIAGVTVTTLGKDGNGNTTGCTGHTAISDAAGNFVLANLPLACTGPQLIGFDGTTATTPAGKYAGVNLIFTLTSGQVTAAPIFVHLPRIDNVETFLVTQNASTDQSYAWSSIPGLAVTVYAGTTFTMPDGTQPNPFPLAAVSVPVDRLPDVKPPVPTMVMVFIVAFQPANASTNQPVAVIYPNSAYNPPGASSVLMTLDPTHGVMVPYGSGTVSNDSTQFVPDPDPAHPGHRYGLVHFDWHMVGTPLGNQMNPCDCIPCPTCGGPVDLSSGLEVIHETDISFGGARGTMSVTRTYRNGINPAATTFGPFGYGTNHNWGYELDSVNPASASVISLVMPDGNQFPFSKQGNGTFINSGIPVLGGGVMTVVNNSTVDLRWKDGITFRFVVLFSAPFFRTLLDSVTDPNGNKFQITHNGLQIQAITDSTGRSLTFNYNVGGHITQITAPDGSNVSYDYRGNSGILLRQVRRTDGSITQYSYDNANNLTSVTDQNGVVFESNTYDANNRVTQQRLANGGVLNFSYTLQNPLAGMLSPVLATTVTDALSYQTVYRFSPNQAVISVTDPLGRMRTIDRDGGNFVVGLHGTGSCPVCGDLGAGDQTFSYDDSTGNLLSHTDGLGNTTSYAYDSVFNKLTSITDPLGKITTFTNDSRGNRLTQTDPNGSVTSYAYDQFGQLIQLTDPVGKTTLFSYDSFGNVASVKDPLGNVVSLQYNANGRLMKTQDAFGRTTAITYDGMGRILSQTNAQGGVTTLAYDELGDLLSITDSRNHKVSFTYDFMGRLLTRTDPLGRKDTRTYDLNHNLTKFVDRRGQTSSFSYDAGNRLTAETYPDATVTRSYDANDRLSQVNDSASGVFAFSYDASGRLKSASSPFGSVNYTYDARNSMTSRQVVGRPLLAYTYDPVGNLASLALAQASANLSYNGRNQIVSINRSNGVTSSFGYDADGRLLSLNHAKAASIIDAENYAYDLVGNRVSHNTSIGQSATTQPITSQFDVSDELTAFGAVPNSYDANGNLVQDGTATYNWDGRNRLKSIVTAAGQTTNFTYDFAGNLIQQADSGAALNLTKTFVLDDLTNIAFEAASDGNSYDVLSGQSIDSHMAIIRSSGQAEYGLTDAINSTITTVDQNGALVSQFLYDAFGKTTATGTYPFQYTGRLPVSGSLYHYRARYYDSLSGRFISEDQLGVASDKNQYAYAANDPASNVDPTGSVAKGIRNILGAVVLLLKTVTPPSVVQPVFETVIERSDPVAAARAVLADELRDIEAGGEELAKLLKRKGAKTAGQKAYQACKIFGESATVDELLLNIGKAGLTFVEFLQLMDIPSHPPGRCPPGESCSQQ
jgi:RHS repeat-associated protein